MPIHLARFALVALLCVGIYRGYGPVRILAVALFSIQAVRGIVLFISYAEHSVMARFPLLMMTFVYGYFAYMLVFSKDVNTLFRWQREKRGR